MSDKGCPSCGQVMKVRVGKFGEFYFCQDQAICGQKTITKQQPNVESVSSGFIPSGDSAARLGAMMDYDGSDLSPLMGRSFDGTYEDNGDDFRPHG